MYNKLLIKDRRTGKVDIAIHGDLVEETLTFRLDDYEDELFIRHSSELSKKEVDDLIEYLQEFKRLLKEK